MPWTLVFGFGLVTCISLFLFRKMRARSLDRWLFSYVIQSLCKKSVNRNESVHLILCIADHFEPGLGNASFQLADERLDRWINEYPRQFSQFRDTDGRPPRHTFFYPLEMYRAEHLEALSKLCRQGYGEVEVHLHHDNDDSESLRTRLNRYKEHLAREHGLLPRDRETGELRYGFIHGNWALDNSHPEGKQCGVNNELDILRESGCYADFTMPSAPDPTQTRTINSIYYAFDDPDKPKSHDRGVPVGFGIATANALLMIQGPLVLDWRRRKWGLIPRVENGCIQANQPASIERLPAWLKAGVQVPSRPDWFFVKLHTHGAPEWNQKVLLGDAMVRFHQDLADHARTNDRFHFHYVTAREMYNLVRAAQDGWQGDVASARDYCLVWDEPRPALGSKSSEAPSEAVARRY
ncbi:MAG: hypothetical protein ACLP7Q_11745 [Isosphaeraceae bacterium]